MMSLPAGSATAVVTLFVTKRIQTANSFGDFVKDSAFNFVTTAPLLIPGGFAWKGEAEGLKLGIRLAWWEKALVRGTE